MLHTEDIHERVQNAAIFGIAFAVIGYIIPILFFTLMPPSYFFNVDHPVGVDKPFYKRCDDIQLALDKHSKINAQAVSSLELTLVYEGGGIQDFAQRTKNINISAGNERILTDWQIPCEVPTGKYFINGVIDFDAGHQQKSYAFTTDYFLVN